jgi:phenylacetate-CoA ligase
MFGRFGIFLAKTAGKLICFSLKIDKSIMNSPISSSLCPAATFHPHSSMDYVPTDLLRELQSKRLCEIVYRAYHNVEFYRTRMDQLGVKPEDIRGVEDIAKLPTTIKTDLRDTYPDGLFAIPMRDIVRLHASSGTTGKPIVVAYNQHDLDVWANVVVRALSSYGIHEGDILQNAYGYGLFTGGLGLHYGAEELGATVVPISGGNTDRQIMMMRDFGVTAISCTPSYFVHLIERAKEMNVDLRDLPIRAGIFGAEPWTNEMRKYIEENAGIKAFDIYGLTEICGPGVAAECCCQHGLHIFEDNFYPEIIDPETCQPLPDGEKGELVITTLNKQAMPLLRYRTRDITSLSTDQCSCGRTLRRIFRISHRSDDMFIIRGVNVFPSQIEAAILTVESTLPHYQIVLSRNKGLDEVDVRIEVTAELFSDRISVMEDLQRRIASAIEHTVGIRIKVTLAEPHTIQRSEGKAKRVLDMRQI